MQEVAVEHRHVGKFSELDGSHAVLLMPLAGHIDGHGAQGLLPRNGFPDVARIVLPAEHFLRIHMFFRRINAVLDIHQRRYRIIRMEHHVRPCVKEGFDRIRLI